MMKEVYKIKDVQKQQLMLEFVLSEKVKRKVNALDKQRSKLQKMIDSFKREVHDSCK